MHAYMQTCICMSYVHADMHLHLTHAPRMHHAWHVHACTHARTTHACACIQVGPSAALPAGCAVACVHGCKGLTDQIIAAAVDADACSVALMPCCHPSNAAGAPEGLKRALGAPLAADIHRTYTLEAGGFQVGWRAIPRVISPMNRILIASRPRSRHPRASLLGQDKSAPVSSSQVKRRLHTSGHGHAISSAISSARSREVSMCSARSREVSMCSSPIERQGGAAGERRVDRQGGAAIRGVVV